ncbi:Hypothetical predicted protein [Marmota monax]|uniref:Uncharacterized protein n=1 Tax=Marmota monax TaxID=9995 RepID=A0A5E4AMN0_MARMO|nr:hypothetical protein GHT09_001479 [Marmota monax]VTJ58578.1 Hypothetical predicted protein [Marmota monax]
MSGAPSLQLLRPRQAEPRRASPRASKPRGAEPVEFGSVCLTPDPAGGAGHLLLPLHEAPSPAAWNLRSAQLPPPALGADPWDSGSPHSRSPGFVPAMEGAWLLCDHWPQTRT